jgi:hypothetical protein
VCVYIYIHTHLSRTTDPYKQRGNYNSNRQFDIFKKLQKRNKKVQHCKWTFTSELWDPKFVNAIKIETTTSVQRRVKDGQKKDT